MTEYEKALALFEADMQNVYTEPLRSKHHYNAGYFRRLLELYKAIGTALYLIDQDEISYGLNKLYEIGMLHCSVEAIVLKPEYRVPGFEPSTPERREKARRKLREEFGYTAETWSNDACLRWVGIAGTKTTFSRHT